MGDLVALRNILSEAGLENEEGSVSYYDEGVRRYVEFSFPVAREYEKIQIFEDDDIDTILCSDFTKYRGISNYEAI